MTKFHTPRRTGSGLEFALFHVIGQYLYLMVIYYRYPVLCAYYVLVLVDLVSCFETSSLWIRLTSVGNTDDLELDQSATWNESTLFLP